MASVEERLQHLEDLEAIRRRKHGYSELVDRFASGEEYAAQFTEDGIIDGDFGPFEGRAAIAEFFGGVKDTGISFFLHYMCGERIDIAPNGTDAKAHWYLWEPATINDEAVWIAITYDDEYRKVNGEWLISRQTFHNHFVTPIDKGWVKQPFVEMDV